MKLGTGQVWLAKQLGITQGRVSKLINGERWTFGKGPWKKSDLPAIKAHMLERRYETGGPTAERVEETASDDEIAKLSRNPEKQERIKLLVARRVKIQLDTALLSGEHIKKKDVEAGQAARVYAVRAKFQELVQRAALIAMKSEAECEAILESWAKEICNGFASTT